jgi:CBS domain-containing protein
VWHPVVGALVWASLGLFVPRALGVGYDVIDDALAGRLAIATLATLALGKLVIWWIALASGTSGGTLAPILLISSCSGALVGGLLSRACPGLGLSPSAFALVAMAATFGAAARAPFAAIVFVFELTRDYNAILPLMLATVLADLLARTLLRQIIMTEKLARRGVAVPAAFHADPLRTTPVRAVMAFSDASTHEDVPADTGVWLQPDDTLYTALLRMVEEEVEQLPVAAQGRLIGVCTRAGILEGRIRHLGHERPERGWLALPRTRTLASSDGGG